MAPNSERCNSPTAFGLLDEMSPVLTMGGAPRLTKRQWLTLVAIGSVHFSSAICISLQAPFYPREAELKNATATEYGLVFGSFELVSFLSSPILGKYLHSIGLRTELNLGMVVASICAILFGMLDYVKDHDWFISLSFLLRMTEALGSTAALVAAFSITAAVFPNSIGTTFATLEVFYGMGYIVGPTIGGFFFSIGGYKLPFVMNGLAMLFIAFFIAFILPPVYTEARNHKSAGIIAFLKVPAIFLNSACVVGTAISMGYYAATLEPHLRQFNLTPVAMGLMFVISGGTYACVAPIIGRICDRWAYPKRVISVGCLLIVTSYSLVGPAPFLPIPKTLLFCIIGLVVHGVGLACTMVPTFMDSICSAVSNWWYIFGGVSLLAGGGGAFGFAVRPKILPPPEIYKNSIVSQCMEVRAAGFNDDIGTYGILSGLWTASFSLGAFIGPSIAGVLYDSVGFRNGTLFVIFIHIALFIICSCFITFEKQRSLPPNRIRLLSERMEVEEDSSDFEPFPTLTKDSISNNLLMSWDGGDGKVKANGKSNGYGAIIKSIEIL